jgi:O-antigen/teichoic acid export membrane protein
MYFRIDTVMLSILQPHDVWQRSVATYQVAYRFSDLLGFLGAAMFGVVLAPLVYSWPERIVEFRRLVRHAIVLLAVIVPLPVAFFVVLADKIVVSFFGQRYAGAVGPARLLVVAQAINLVTELAFVVLVAAGRRLIYLWAAGAGTVFNVALNALLIPHFGVTGSAWATIGTELVVVLVLGRELLALPIHPLPGRPILVCTGAGVTVGAVLFVVRDVAPWPLLGVIACIAYAAAVHVLRVERPRGLVTLLEHSRFDPAPDD